MKVSTDFGESDDIPASLSKYLDWADDFDVFGEPRSPTIEARPNVFLTPFDSKEENEIEAKFGGGLPEETPLSLPATPSSPKQLQEGRVKDNSEGGSKTRSLLFPRSKKSEREVGPSLVGKHPSKWLEIPCATPQRTQFSQSFAARLRLARMPHTPLTQLPKINHCKRFSKQLNCVKSLRFGEWGLNELQKVDSVFLSKGSAQLGSGGVFRKYKLDLAKSGLPMVSETPRALQPSSPATPSQKVSRSPSKNLALIRSLHLPSQTRTPLKKTPPWLFPSDGPGTPGTPTAVRSHSKSPLLKKGCYF